MQHFVNGKRKGISLIEVVIALAVLATLTASLASSMVSNTTMRKSVVETQTSLQFQRALQETLLAVSTTDLTTAAWATMAVGYSQSITEANAMSPALAVYAPTPSQLVSAGLLSSTDVAPASVKIFIQYHWATTANGHRGILDTGSDGTDSDSAPDPWPTSAAAAVGMTSPTVLAASLIADGVASVPDGTPFVVRMVVAWDDHGRGGAAGRISTSATNASSAGLTRVTTLYTTRMK